jgi:superfamily II DNA or RNA helicase
MRLEDLAHGMVVQGLSAGQPVTVQGLRWIGQNAVEVTYRSPEGFVDCHLVYRSDEDALRAETPGQTWAFDGDGAQFKLAAEARRIRLAHLFDPMLAVHLSRIRPLPHQIDAVYGQMVPRQPLRYALCDDPGAGKTIMAGLYIRELILRGEVRRCLVVAPGSLVTQWQDELQEKFDLRFDLVTRDAVEASYSGKPFADKNLLIARLDHLARNEVLVGRACELDWDLVVVDEAHRMSAHFFGSEIKRTKRYQVGERLGSSTRNLLLMTATPHAGKEEDFQLWLALLDTDRFEGKPRDGVHSVAIGDLMRRMVKEQLLQMDGRPLFPERRAYTVPFQLSDLERALYEAVTEYVRYEMNRAERMRQEGDGRRGNLVGFALTVLQRRLASSPEAIYQSLARRRARLQRRAAELRGEGERASLGAKVAQVERLLRELGDDDESSSADDLADDELEEIEDVVVDDASTATTLRELEIEIATLARLEELAARVRDAGQDRKWQELSALFDAPEMRTQSGGLKKLIVFTEHRDTLNYLRDRLAVLVGRSDAIVTLHGGNGREERRAIQERFLQDPECVVLVATDAAGEGINLQRAHLMVNYDLPWNPNRIEQRFGRIHRIGQEEVCHLWNLVAEDTREGSVFLLLLWKLEEQRVALGTDQVFDVLGEAFEGRPLRDLLIEAVRYGDDPARKAELERVIDERVGDGLADLIREHALDSTVLDQSGVARIRQAMEEAAARRLQPHYVKAFFLEAFGLLGGKAIEREPGRFEITRVPALLRARDRQVGGGAPLLHNYERVCFDKEQLRAYGAPPAALVCPGHALLDTVVDLTIEQHAALLRQGTILVDDDDAGDELRVLVAFEHAITNGRPGAGGQRQVVSKRFEFVAVYADGRCEAAGPAPYLDLRPAIDDEWEAIVPFGQRLGSRQEIEDRAMALVVETSAAAHLASVREHVIPRLEKVRDEVRRRLGREIEHWDSRANYLQDLADAGKQPRMNPDRARGRAEELAARRTRRIAELDAEMQLASQAPVLAGIALVAPGGLLSRLNGDASGPTRDPVAIARIQHRAENAVLVAERALGNQPELLPHNNPGFDIRSTTPEGELRLIEVKGRIAGAETFSVTRNEILTGLNAPDQFVLALVSVAAEDRDDEVRYVRRPFTGADAPFFGTTSVTFGWAELWTAGTMPA